MKIRIRIVPQEDRTYSVEVTEPREAPYTVPGFKSEAKAEVWATERATKIMDHWMRQANQHKES